MYVFTYLSYIKTTDCSSNPCTNDAYCQTKATESVKCHCQKGYKGQFCEKGTYLANLQMYTNVLIRVCDNSK